MTLTPLGIVTDATTSWIVSQVNAALGSDVLTLSDDNGLSVGLAVAGEPRVAVDNLQSGPSGVSGRLHIDGLDTAPLSADLFGDFSVALSAFDVTVANGGIASLHIAGALTIPYFTNRDGSAETVDIDVSVRSDGTLAVTLSAQQSGSTTPDGLVQLHYDLPLDATIDLEIAALEIDRDTAGVWKVTVSGSLALGTGAAAGQSPLAWPSVDLRGLSIDSAGHVTLAGGWIDLPSQAALDFYGFHIALQKLGLGNDQSGRWIGFTGDIHLVEGISLGGSVRGLQINLDTGSVSFTGVAIDFEIPGVIAFTGDVEHMHLNPGDDPTTQGLPASFPTPADVFAGGVDITIEVAALEIQGTFIVANVTISGVATPCFFLTLDAELPVGIPLFLDIALYGLSGLFATNLYPTVGDDTWWNWFKYPTVNGAPDETQGADYTATDPDKWLNPRPGAFALGAGATIGTQDDGFTASAAIAFMIILPGPVFSLIGRANILSKRIDGPSGPANFDAMATFDGNTGIFDLVIDAQYSIPVVLEIQGTAEVYVNPSPPVLPSPVWFLALGKPPHEKRVSARVLDLFESDGYFVISDTGIVTGFWVGYRNSWSFGPLSVSIDAYIAGQGAVQWSPFQIAAGVELHGEVHLDAFGIGLGLTADALLEATAPNPWWIYGSFQVEIDLPWPLPNIGASVSLSWGGNDGSVPPVPLALNVVNATLADHGASDRYELLAHRPKATVNEKNPGDTVVYDSGATGMLAAQPTGYWAGLYPSVESDASPVLPDLVPDQLARAALVPQDSHFALTFAHPVVDGAGFANPSAVQPESATVSTPPIVGPDDMSNLDLTPAVQWLIRHSLVELALYQYDDAAEVWDLAAATPQGTAPLPLAGTWMAPDPAKNGAKPMTALRVSPYLTESGQSFMPTWSGAAATLGTTFIDQDLTFVCGIGLHAAAIATGSGLPSGLRFAGQGTVTITFPTAVQLGAVAGVHVGSGKSPFTPLQVSDGNGQPLPLVATSTDGSGVSTLQFDGSAPLVTAIQIEVGSGQAYLMAVSYSTPDVRLAILPDAPAMYALKTVTRVEAGRVDSSGNANSQPVPDGDPIIEFAYFQCASGPGTAVFEPGPVGPSGFRSPLPFQAPPQPSLAEAAGSPSSASPTGGRLNDLATYTQWSWPGDGDMAAYYGYDVNVEFDETYVVDLYAAFGAGGTGGFTATSRQAGGFPLHFRCVDRNNDHTLLVPIAVHVGSVPQQSALVGAETIPAMPATIDPQRQVVNGLAGIERAGTAIEVATTPTPSAVALKGAAELLDWAHAAAVSGTSTPTAAGSPAAHAALQGVLAGAGVGVGIGSLKTGLVVDPGLYGLINHELEEQQAAAAAQALWFKPLAPATRYSLDVVAGALVDERGRASRLIGGLETVFDQSDAINTLAALEGYLAREDALTTLQRVQFTTSRYATFADQVANIGLQLAGAGATPVRRYAAPGDLSAATWLASAGHDGNRPTLLTDYQQARSDLASMVWRFDGLFDETLAQPFADATQGNGEVALRAQRMVTELAWQKFAAATSESFDGLIAALGRPDLASSQKVPAPPDTEVSLLTVNSDAEVTAFLIESPEPIPWRRLWPWLSLQPADFRSPSLPTPFVLWSTDGTRALIVPDGKPEGAYFLSMAFQGNIGAEISCITLAGTSVTERVAIGPILLAPYPIRRPRLLESPVK